MKNNNFLVFKSLETSSPNDLKNTLDGCLITVEIKLEIFLYPIINMCENEEEQ